VSRDERDTGIAVGARIVTDLRFAGPVILAAVAIGCATAGLSTPPPKHACEVLTEREITKVFGGTVRERKREATDTSSRCEFDVGADGLRPAGFVIVQVVFAEAKAAYDDLKKPGRGYIPLPELSNALGNETLRIVDVLAGDVLVGVQGISVDDPVVPVPAHFYDVHSELLELARLAVRGL
jgi:hypothetical protein